MAHITVLGGTGYAGSNVVAIATSRGHEVVAYSRSAASAPVDGVEYRIGDLTDPATQAAAVLGADVVVSALSPRGELEGAGKLRALLDSIAGLAREQNVRFGVVGGAGSLLVADGGPALADTDGFPDAFKQEAAELASVLDDLRASSAALDWFFVSPAGGFGPWAPGEATGTYRVGGDVLLVDEHGDSAISGADLALAVVTEIEEPAHHRARFTVAY